MGLFYSLIKTKKKCEFQKTQRVKKICIDFAGILRDGMLRMGE